MSVALEKLCVGVDEWCQWCHRGSQRRLPGQPSGRRAIDPLLARARAVATGFYIVADINNACSSDPGHDASSFSGHLFCSIAIPSESSCRRVLFCSCLGNHQWVAPSVLQQFLNDTMIWCASCAVSERGGANKPGLSCPGSSVAAHSSGEERQ